MEEAAAKKRREIGPGFVLSILLHVLFAAIFLLPLLPAPPQAKPEDSVNVELVPQPEEKKEVATKENEKPDQPPTPDEKPQPKTEEAKQEQQPQGQKPDEPQKQPEDQNKEQAEKPASKAAASTPDKPAEKPEQQATAAEAPVPDMKGDQKDPSTTQEADATAKADETPTTPSSDSQAEQQAAAEAAAESAAQAAEQVKQAQQQQNTQTPADTKEQEAENAAPTANDPASKPSSSAPAVLATNQASDMQVQQPQVPSTDQNGSQAQDSGDKSSSDPQQQTPAEPTKEEAKTEPQIAVPTVRPSPTEQASQSQSASSSQGGETSGTAVVTEPQAKSGAPKRAIQAKKLYSGAEMARLSKSDYDAWKKMPQRQRVAYLCNSEEKLQYRHDLGAVGYVNSALSPAMVSDTSLFGNGVAVQTPDGWQRVEFTCQVDNDALKVVAFSYAVKGHVPPSQLDKLGFAGN